MNYLFNECSQSRGDWYQASRQKCIQFMEGLPPAPFRVLPSMDSDEYVNCTLVIIGELLKCGGSGYSKYVIEHVDADMLNAANALGRILLSRYEQNRKNDDDTEIVRLLVSKAGVDINLVASYRLQMAFGVQHTFKRSPLQQACEQEDVVLTKLLLENGTHKSYSITKYGRWLLDQAKTSRRDLIWVKTALEKGTIDIEETTKLSPKAEKFFAQTKNAIEAPLFGFFCGKFDPNSPLSSIPKEVIVKILACLQKPWGNAKKINLAQKQIDAAISKLCEGPLLFSLGQSDTASTLGKLPPEMIAYILRKRAALV